MGVSQLEGSMHIYHISTERNLVKIKNNKFCAPLYLPHGFNSMHIELKRMHEKLSEERALYRFCFYDDLNKTKESFESDFSQWKSYIFRFKHQEILDLGFNWQWDEGFNEGEAHLFWIEENKTDNSWSELGIPFNETEVFEQGKWVTLDLFFPKLLERLHLVPKQSHDLPEPENIKINTKQSFIEKLANKLFKRDK